MANLEVVEPSPAPTIGSLIHVGMAAHYGRRWAGLEADTSIRPDELAAPVDAVHVEATARGWSDFEPPAAATMAAYVNLPADPFPGRVVAVEQVMKLGEDGELGISSVTKKPRLYSQRLDLAVESFDRKVWITDHKSTSGDVVRASDTYTMSGQMIGYRVLGQRRWGPKFGGVMLNMVGVVRGGGPLKQRTIQVPPAPASDASFLETVIGLDERKEAMMLRYGTDGVASAFRYPQVLSDLVCYHRYGPCEFMPLCRFGKGMLGFYKQRERGPANPAPTATVDSQTTTPVHGTHAVEPERDAAPTDTSDDVIDL